MQHIANLWNSPPQDLTEAKSSVGIYMGNKITHSNTNSDKHFPYQVLQLFCSRA